MEHLREAIQFDVNSAQLVSSEDSKKYPLRESESKIVQVEGVLREAEKLCESLKGDDKDVMLKVIQKLREAGITDSVKTWKLPIGRYGNLNGNKRIYTRKLWENVMNNQQDLWKGVCGLMDHPEKDNDPGLARDQAVVWLDMQIDDDPDQGLVYGIGRFVGDHGRLAQEIMEMGGKSGLSSSGFGDVDKVTHVVDPDTYIIERLADLVINPSQGIYGTNECTHTAGEFMDDVKKGATIEFKKQTALNESQPQSSILRRSKMNNDTQQPQAQAATPAQPQQPAQQQQAQPQQQVQESAKEPIKESVLNKVEEKAFRKYVSAFIDDAAQIENPIHRLNECTEILGFFENGACPDLKEKLEETLKAEKERLEKLIEKAVETEKEYGVDLEQLTENALNIAAEGKILEEQVLDYKELCDELTKRNKILLEDNKELHRKLKLSERLTERIDQAKNKVKVDGGVEKRKLSEEIKDLTRKNRRLAERVSELSIGNKNLEKTSGRNDTKLREAIELLKKSKNERVKLTEENEKLRKEASGLKSRLREASELMTSKDERLAAATGELKKLQEEIKANDPTLHMLPSSSDRIGKFLNLRERKGSDVEAYWQDLKEQYGVAVDPFEDEIRDCKTLREATSAFLKRRTDIDPDFKVAQPLNQFAYRNRGERAKLMEHQGVPVPQGDAATEAINADFARRMEAAGLN